MRSRRIHIAGASGSGVTSLGRALASTLASSHHDTDDYFWLPTTPPYRLQRDVAERLRLMNEMFVPRADWVLSGALDGWGNELIPCFDLVVFLKTPLDIRMQRLRAREAAHFGDEAVAPAAGVMRKQSPSSNGHRTTKTARARVAVSSARRHGLRGCPAPSCGSTGRGR